MPRSTVLELYSNCTFSLRNHRIRKVNHSGTLCTSGTEEQTTGAAVTLIQTFYSFTFNAYDSRSVFVCVQGMRLGSRYFFWLFLDV